MITRTLRFGLLLAASAWAQGPVGIFEGQSDVGKVLHAGSVEYDGSAKSYTVSGSGENMWAGEDDFHFVWKKVSTENVSISAVISILGDAKEGHTKGVLMMRQSLDGDSAYVDAARHADGLTSLQFRAVRGEITREVESSVAGPTALRIEKQGDRFYLWVGNDTREMKFAGGSATVAMKVPFYVGVGVCSHQKDAVERVTFNEVELVTKAAGAKASYSTVETVLISGDARAGYVSPKRLTNAGWSADGQKLTFEVGGKQEEAEFLPYMHGGHGSDVGSALPAMADSGTTYLSSYRGDSMQIWRANGQQPVQVTFDGYNNVSPRLSPDGKYVVMLSYPKGPPKEGEVMLRLLTVANDQVKLLTTFVGGLDSLGKTPWSPDGRRVTFISYQDVKQPN